jgi:hypothetical protein
LHQNNGAKKIIKHLISLKSLGEKTAEKKSISKAHGDKNIIPSAK